MGSRPATAKRHSLGAALPKGVDDPNLRELLDHLGCLIAKEYVALLKKSRPIPAEPTEKVKP